MEQSGPKRLHYVPLQFFFSTNQLCKLNDCSSSNTRKFQKEKCSLYIFKMTSSGIQHHLVGKQIYYVLLNGKCLGKHFQYAAWKSIGQVFWKLTITWKPSCHSSLPWLSSLKSHQVALCIVLFGGKNYIKNENISKCLICENDVMRFLAYISKNKTL